MSNQRVPNAIVTTNANGIAAINQAGGVVVPTSYDDGQYHPSDYAGENGQYTPTNPKASLLNSINANQPVTTTAAAAQQTITVTDTPVYTEEDPQPTTTAVQSTAEDGDNDEETTTEELPPSTTSPAPIASTTQASLNTNPPSSTFGSSSEAATPSALPAGSGTNEAVNKMVGPIVAAVVVGFVLILLIIIYIKRRKIASEWRMFRGHGSGSPAWSGVSEKGSFRAVRYSDEEEGMPRSESTAWARPVGGSYLQPSQSGNMAEIQGQDRNWAYADTNKGSVDPYGHYRGNSEDLDALLAESRTGISPEESHRQYEEANRDSAFNRASAAVYSSLGRMGTRNSGKRFGSKHSYNELEGSYDEHGAFVPDTPGRERRLPPIPPQKDANVAAYLSPRKAVAPPQTSPPGTPTRSRYPNIPESPYSRSANLQKPSIIISGDAEVTRSVKRGQNSRLAEMAITSPSIAPTSPSLYSQTGHTPEPPIAPSFPSHLTHLRDQHLGQASHPPPQQGYRPATPTRGSSRPLSVNRGSPSIGVPMPRAESSMPLAPSISGIADLVFSGNSKHNEDVFGGNYTAIPPRRQSSNRRPMPASEKRKTAGQLLRERAEALAGLGSGSDDGHLGHSRRDSEASLDDFVGSVLRRD